MSDTESLLAYNLPPVRDALARAYAQKGESYKAIAEYESLMEVGPNTGDRRLPNPKHRVRLAGLHESKGWDDRAPEQCQGFLDICSQAGAVSEELSIARARVLEKG